MSLCLSICLSVYLSVCLSLYLSVFLSICLSQYSSINFFWKGKLFSRSTEGLFLISFNFLSLSLSFSLSLFLSLPTLSLWSILCFNAKIVQFGKSLLDKQTNLFVLLVIQWQLLNVIADNVII